MEPTRNSGAPTASRDIDPVVRRLGWASLFFTVAVILGGSIVRATDSGAGCGESWPRCDGHIIPVSTDAATIIEFTHRMMTGALGFALAALLILGARRSGVWRKPSQSLSMLRPDVAVAHFFREIRRYFATTPHGRAVAWSVGLFFSEVVIGALLVVFGWVEDDASVARVIAVSVHLVNTFLLLGALTLTAYLGSGGTPPRVDATRTRDRMVLGGVVILLIVGASGAVNALADTLFPAKAVAADIVQEYGSAGSFLIGVRTFHPMIAIAGGAILFYLARNPNLGDNPVVRRYGTAVQVIIGIQMFAGIVNIALLTPIETQVLHLLIADILWIVWVLLGANALVPERGAVSPEARPSDQNVGTVTSGEESA